jgi:hypothetical protein
MKPLNLLAALMMAATSALAGPGGYPAYAPDPGGSFASKLFDQGFHLGAHGLLVIPDSNLADNALGGGLNADYFLNPYLGFQAAAAWADPGTAHVWQNYTVDGILRAPIETAHIAPYIFAGVGTMIEATTDILGRAGVGLEFRPSSNFGVFTDWIYNFPGSSMADRGIENYQMVRLGVKFGF